MGGVRQFSILFRKNLLLKTRRPLSTCFELTLPIVLFALLAYVRSIYETETRADFYFNENRVFPLSTMIFSPDSHSQAKADVCGADCASTPNESYVARMFEQTGMMGDLQSSMLEGVVCGETGSSFASGLFMPVLTFLWQRDNTTNSVEEWLMSTPSEEIGNQLESLVLEAQDPDFVNNIINEALSRRDSYLNSPFATTLEQATSTLDSTFSWADDELVANATALNDFRREVEDSINELCTLTGWADWRGANVSFTFAGANITVTVGNLVEALQTLSSTIGNGTAVDGVTVGAELGDVINDLFEDGTNATAAGIDIGDFAGAIGALADALAGAGIEINGTEFGLGENFTNLVGQLDFLNQVLEENFGVPTDFIDSVQELARFFDTNFGWLVNMSESLVTLADMLDNSTALRDVGRILDGMTSFLDGMSAAETAEQLEEGLWWMSHFVDADGSTARFLTGLREVVSWSDETPGVYHTSFGPEAERFISWLQTQEWEIELQQFSDDLSLGLRSGNWTGTARWIAELLAEVGNVTGTTVNVDGVQVDVEDLLDGVDGALVDRFDEGLNTTVSTSGISLAPLLRILGYVLGNFTSGDIATAVQFIPDWEREWLYECPRSLNSTEVGDLAVGFAQVANDLRNVTGDLNRGVTELHEWMEGLDESDLRSDAENIQNILMEINATSMRRLGERLAQGYKNRFELGLCLDAAQDGCSSIVDQTTCEASRAPMETLINTTMLGSAGSYVTANRCVWCGGQPCLSTSNVTCLSSEALAAGGDETTAGIDVTVAAVANCTLEDSLQEILYRELQLALDIDCELGDSAETASSSDNNPLGGFMDNDMLSMLADRKIIIAPYKGEVKKMWDLFIVEMIYSLTTLYPSEVKDTEYNMTEFMLDSAVVRTLAAMILENVSQDYLMFMDSEAAMEDYARYNPSEVMAAIVFRNADSEGNFPEGSVDVEYSIRMPSSLITSTSRILYAGSGAMLGRPRTGTDMYLTVFFVHLQEIIGRAAARMQGQRVAVAKNASATELEQNIQATNLTAVGRRLSVSLEQLPAPGYVQDDFIRVIQHTVPMVMILGWIYAVALLVREMVYEKQERLRDVMRIQGLKTWVYWASWMASAMVQMSVLSTIIMAFLCGGEVIKLSDASLIWVFFILYSASTVSLSLLISSFFSRAKVAAACGGMIYYTLYLPYSFYNRYDDTMGTHAKNAMCLLCSSALGVGSAIIAKWELMEEGVQWSNLWTPAPVTYSGSLPTDDHSFGHVLMMLVVDTILYQVAAWYIEKVFPGTLGLPQPWYFPLLKSFWFPTAPQAIAESSNEGNVEQSQNEKLECFESAPTHLRASVKLRQLSKTFRNGKKALSGVTLDMHEDTIVGYLGHNGAGKSTTMAILTGLYPPTSGDALVNGVSICKDSQGVRRQLGVCLQHNALYDNVTVQEHLELFCCLKSVPWETMKEEIDGLLKDTGLEAKRNFPTRALSGGMKRKLSVAIALCGGSKVVTLDEPTAGVDATSRRDIWQLLSKHKAGRTILLSTHFMDEADILSDRIAIIAEGQLTAIGTALSLKRKFTDGYMLTVVARDGASHKPLIKGIVEYVPEARYMGGRGRELTFCLPFGARSRFSTLFQQLQNDDVRNSLFIDSYGLSAASMEEVFLAASSVHEAGLHGKVRNGVDEVEAELSTKEGSSDNGSTATTTAIDAPEDTDFKTAIPDEAVANSPRSNKTPLTATNASTTAPFGASPEASPTVIGSPAAASEETPRFSKDRPQSPQCMGETGDSPKGKSQSQKDQTASRNKAGHGKEDKESLANTVRLSGVPLMMMQFNALFRKRALSVRRDRKAWASQLLLPGIFVMIALIIARMMSITEDADALELNSDMFIGSNSAGSVESELEYNLWHMSGTRDFDFATEVEAALMARGDENDIFEYYEEHPNATLAHYYMKNRRALTLEQGGMSVRGTEEDPRLTLWFKFFGDHINPVLINIWNNARFKMMGFSGARVQAWNHPLPQSSEGMQLSLSDQSQIYNDMLVAITLILAMGFIPASFVVYLVHEKATNGKHQQLLSGIGPVMYWMNSYLWDIINFLIPLAVCALIFVVFGVDSFNGDNLPAVLALIFCYGACMTPFTYCLEPFFTVASTAYVTLIVTNIFTGTLSVLATVIMDAYESEMPDLKPINDFVKAVCPWILPNYCLGSGLIRIATNHYYNYAYEEFAICLEPDGDCPHSPMSWDVSGEFVMQLLIMVPVWLALRLLIEWNFFTQGLRKQAARLLSADASPSENQDAAVALEAKRVEQAMAEAKASGSKLADSLVLTDLRKTFVHRRCGVRTGGAFHAVRGISCSIAGGECFGLLGVNGAGKTTTMRMITGHTDISRGDIFVGGYSTEYNRDKARQRLGYCPQFDALPDKLTVRETVALYARIRGISPTAVDKTVQLMIKKMCLEAHQYQLCENLSGGNKRKLSTALALIGSPDVVLLDEPSTGVDVGARRFLWEVIAGMRTAGHAVILTSHSMEECEVLCTRLTIMVHGEMRCLGTTTELKNNFGGGYTLAVKANLNVEQSGASKGEAKNASTESCSAIAKHIEAQVPSAKLTEESVGLLRYRLGPNTEGVVPLAETFSMLEQAQDGNLKGYITDYSVSQTSLEEVFLHFSQLGEREYAAEQGKEVELPTAAGSTVIPVAANHDAPPEGGATVPPSPTPTLPIGKPPRGGSPGIASRE